MSNLNTPEGASACSPCVASHDESACGVKVDSEARCGASDPVAVPNTRGGASSATTASAKVPAGVESPALAGHGHDLFAPEVLHQPVDLTVREWTLHIPGDPVAKGRGRIMKLGKHMGIQTPAKTRRYEDIVRQTAVREWNRPILQNVPVVMHTVFFLPIAQSWPKKRQQAARSGLAFPLGKPDLSNLAKAIEDGMNAVVYYDDSLLVKTTNEKRYSDNPRVEVTLSW